MQLHWHTEPFLLIAILSISWFYAIWTGPLRHRWDPSRLATQLRLKAVSFHSGVLVIYLAVGSPIDQLGEDYLFFMHMIQHMLLIYVVPVLMYLGMPGALMDHFLKSPGVRGVLKPLVHPVTAGMAFSVIYTGWHIPLLYELALQDKAIHILEHATMFLTAVLMWWAILSPSRHYLPAASYGVQILYAFLLMVGQLPVFAFLSFANVAIYETYVWAPRVIPGLDPLNDQILGGIIMKIFNMVVSLSIISTCFYQWASKDRQMMELELGKT